MLINKNEMPKFGAKQKKVLTEVGNKEKEPGTIVRDFDTLLDYIGTQKALLTKASFLPPETLKKLNSQMSKPIKVDLKRHTQKSYPHINGLFLLLRTSGLIFLSREKSYPLMVIDKEVYASWQKLNNYERYCNLLEIWLTRGNPEIIKSSSGFRSLPLHPWLAFFVRAIPPQDAHLLGQNKGKGLEISDFKYIPGTHNLGLLEFFGFIEIEHGRLKKGAGWQIAKVKITPLGNALLSLLVSDQEILESFGLIFWDAPLTGQPLGQLQSLLQPYFPKWQNNLITPKQNSFVEGRYIFKVSLGKVWRKISISAHEDFDELSSAILSAFNFDDDHLYSFSYEARFGNEEEVNHPYMEEGGSADEITLGEIALTVGAQISFLFDFGDNWRFDIVLEKIIPEDDKSSPKIIEKQGKPPKQYH